MKIDIENKKSEINNLYEQGKLLVRAMDNPSLTKEFYTGEFSYDFSTWANEYEIAKNEGLTSLSTTLIMRDENIPTYKSIGFLINSKNVDVRHVAEHDSGSCGNEKNGDFIASKTNVESISELADIIKNKHEKVMNEVNINMDENAYIGLFANQTESPRQLSHLLMAQKYYELQTGIVLPIYDYNSMTGNLEEINLTIEEKMNILEDCLNKKILRTPNLFYETETGEYKNINFIEVLQQEMKNKRQKSDSSYKKEYGEKIRPENKETEQDNSYEIKAQQIGKTTINTPTQAKQEAEKVEAENIHTQDKVNEGESLDDN